MHTPVGAPVQVMPFVQSVSPVQLPQVPSCELHPGLEYGHCDGLVQPLPPLLPELPDEAVPLEPLEPWLPVDPEELPGHIGGDPPPQSEAAPLNEVAHAEQDPPRAAAVFAVAQAAAAPGYSIAVQ